MRSRGRGCIPDRPEALRRRVRVRLCRPPTRARRAGRSPHRPPRTSRRPASSSRLPLRGAAVR
ncbi:MAG: hypothetical protein C4551_04925 [Bacillota bacterium]|nr:MAG: hypothetical protein C4551_04925 [Bacillota bacterium]